MFLSVDLRLYGAMQQKPLIVDEVCICLRPPDCLHQFCLLPFGSGCDKGL